MSFYYLLSPGIDPYEFGQASWETIVCLDGEDESPAGTRCYQLSSV